MKEIDADALAEIRALEVKDDFDNPRYMELLNDQHYVHHVLRMPVEDWPDPVRPYPYKPGHLHPHAGPKRAGRKC